MYEKKFFLKMSEFTQQLLLYVTRVTHSIIEDNISIFLFFHIDLPYILGNRNMKAGTKFEINSYSRSLSVKDFPQHTQIVE